MFEYVDALNILTAKTKIVLIEPITALTHAIATMHKDAHTILDSGARGMLEATSRATAALTSSITSLADSSIERINSMVQQSAQYFYPDPDLVDPLLNMAWKSADASAHEKEGYLFVRTNAVTHSWRRCYISIVDGLLSMIEPQQEKIIMQLRDARAHAMTVDDRRFVFGVQSPIGNKRITLQAECDRSMQVI